MTPLLLKARVLSFFSLVLPEPYRSGCKALHKALVENPDHPILKINQRMDCEIDPRVRARFLRNFILGWLIKGHRIRKQSGTTFPPLLLISVTDACNYRCRGCYAAGHEKGREMSREMVDRLIGEAVSYGTNHFVILGGEPFLWPYLIDTFRTHKNCWFQVYTNGSRIDQDIAYELRKAGNVQVMISLEGLRENTDTRRGEGAFDNCIEAMANLRAERLPFGVGITACRSNLDEIISDRFVGEMVNRGCLFLWYFCYMPYGGEPDFGEVLSFEDRLRLSSEIRRIRNSFPVIAADQIADCAEVGGCSARSGMTLHITTAGLVEACAQMHFSDCSVADKSIIEVLESSEFLRMVKSPAANPMRACFLLDCCSEALDIIERSGAEDNTNGADTDRLKRMAAMEREESIPAVVNDSYQPLIRLFFEMLKP